MECLFKKLTGIGLSKENISAALESVLANNNYSNEDIDLLLLLFFNSARIQNRVSIEPFCLNYAIHHSKV
jgi:hypothetical protein